jgi:cyanobactin maturation PatA/PatG family protease
LANSGEPEVYLNKAVALCAEKNVLIVAAAGNDGCDCLHVPAAVPSVLAVGAMDERGEPLPSSNWGVTYRVQGVLAPGADIFGAVPGRGIARKTGTSFATAMVTGIAALLLSLQRKRGDAPDPRAVRSAILRGALPCNLGDESACRRILAGRLDIRGAVASLSRVRPQEKYDTEAPQLRLSAAAASPDVTQAVDDKYTSPPGEKYVQTETVEVAQVQLSEASSAAPDILSRDGVMPSADTGVSPSDCGCGGKCAAPAKPALVYALGLLTYDFGTEARRDSLVQNGLTNPNDPEALVAFMNSHPEFATAVTWVLLQEATPIYAIHPAGAFAAETYDRLRQILHSQSAEGVEQVSIPGYLVGKTTLLNGQVLPVLVPELRGVSSWSIPALVAAVAGKPPAKSDEKNLAAFHAKASEVGNFLGRVYYEIRNLGLTSQERAMNYAATNAFQVDRVFERAIGTSMKLDSIDVERSPICRPGSDCWDVKLTFFNPSKRFDVARHVYRFTIDVSDVIPVTVGKVRDWDVY